MATILDSAAVDSLSKWFSTRGGSPLPQGTTASTGGFGCHTGERGCYWYLVGGGQGRRQKSHSAQDSLPRQRIIQLSVSNAKVETSALSLLRVGTNAKQTAIHLV